ncbi:MAG TPA: type II toxin-antitoxin system RelE/ParE family toxin [Longimicrobium sp.]|nr:type II toxin-antitoxin system RelE/ParE family toxin [Longimicrobium sp.]
MSDALEVETTEWFEEEVLALPGPDQNRINRRLRGLPRKGWNAAIRDGTVSPLRDGIHELRIMGRGSAYRILFFLMPGRTPRLVVLTTCATKELMKKRQRMDAEIERAKWRRALWMEQQKRRTDER